MRRRNRRSDRPTLNATVVVVSSQMGQRLSFLKKRIRGPFWTRRQKENAAQWDGSTKGTWLRGFARIVAAVDGGIGLTSFDEEGEEGREGKGREGTDSRDWHQEMMMMTMGREERRNKKLQMNSLGATTTTASEIACRFGLSRSHLSLQILRGKFREPSMKFLCPWPLH